MPEPRSVLHVADRDTGGVPVAVRTYILNSADGYQHDVLLPAVLTENPSWVALPAVLHPLPQHHLARFRALRRVIAALDPETVHAHSSFAGLYVRLAVGRRRRRIVYTPHCYAFERQDIGPVRRALFRAAEWVLARNTTVVAACSRDEARLARAVSPARVQTIEVPNVATIARSAPTTRSTSEPVRIATVGRISFQKGPDRFIQVVEELRGRGIDVEAVWIGTGDDDAVAAMSAAGVEVTGWLTADGVSDALRGADLYIHTASWEGFPLAVLDAHTAGLPVLVRAIRAFSGIPPQLTLEQGLASLVDALAVDDDRSGADATGAARFDSWADANRLALDAYLAEHTVENQRAALAIAWG